MTAKKGTALAVMPSMHAGTVRGARRIPIAHPRIGHLSRARNWHRYASPYLNQQQVDPIPLSGRRTADQEGIMEVRSNELEPVTKPGSVYRLAPYSHGLIVVLAALILSLPCLIRGIPLVGDTITHVQYQRHFSDQFWAGDLYPRWLMNANKRYGSPVFLVQYPLPYWITALIRLTQ